MQIECSEGKGLKLAGVGTEAEEGPGEGMGARIDIGKRCDSEREVGMGSGSGRTDAFTCLPIVSVLMNLGSLLHDEGNQLAPSKC
jgi:hypothetical protein